jgi:hypothetical protein
MISLTDCIGLCGLTPEEVEAIAEHEHVPEIVAATMGAYLLDSERGPETIRDMMIDDIRSAVHRHDLPHARHVMAALRHFLAEHPGLALRP